MSANFAGSAALARATTLRPPPIFPASSASCPGDALVSPAAASAARVPPLVHIVCFKFRRRKVDYAITRQGYPGCNNVQVDRIFSGFYSNFLLVFTWLKWVKNRFLTTKYFRLDGFYSNLNFFFRLLRLKWLQNRFLTAKVLLVWNSNSKTSKNHQTKGTLEVKNRFFPFGQPQ